MQRYFRKIALIVLALTALTATAANESLYDRTAAKAARFFEAREWASAQALYGLMLDERPDSLSTYVHAIVASSLLGHEQTAARLLTDAMTAGISFTGLMQGVKTVSFKVGEADVYEEFLLRSQRDCPWLERAIDAELLSYYKFRDNGPLTVAYAEKMLAGLPGSARYLADLADGYTTEADFGKAVEAWEKILEGNPRDYLALLHLGNYYAITGDNNRAAGYLSRAFEIKQTPYVAQRLADLRREQ